MGSNNRSKSPRIPEGFQELLEALSYDVLKQQPNDVLRYCVQNLTQKLEQVDGKACCARPLVKEPEADFAADAKDASSSIQLTQSEVIPVRSTVRRQGVAAESWDPEAVQQGEKVFYEKTEAQKDALLHAVRHVLLFKCLDEDDRMEVVDAMFEKKVTPGENIITCGEIGDNFYVIESGTYDVLVMIDGQIKKVSQYNNEGSFGELALMYNTPRAATITAVTEGVVWAMDRDTFRNIVLTKAFKKRRLYETLLESVELLKSLSAYERMNLADALQTRIVGENEAVFLEGDVGTEMYFIESGSVVISMHSTNEGEEDIELCRLGQNEFFGELALLTKNPRAASVYALERTRLAILEVESFERILGPCQDLLERRAKEYAAQRKHASLISKSR